jgi:hypothetical protein
LIAGYLAIVFICAGAWVASGGDENSLGMVIFLGLTSAAVYTVAVLA